MQVFRIDSNGFFIDPFIIDNNAELPNDCIELEPTKLYKAKWDGEKWIEGATDDEIKEINTPKIIVLY